MCTHKELLRSEFQVSDSWKKELISFVIIQKDLSLNFRFWFEVSIKDLNSDFPRRFS